MLEAVATFCDQLVPSLTWGVKQQYDAQRTCYITPSFHINLRGGGTTPLNGTYGTMGL